MEGIFGKTENMSGKWGSVVKRQYSPVAVENAVVIPALQSILVALPVGMAAAIGAAVVVWPAMGAWAGVGLGLAAGGVGFSLAWYRDIESRLGEVAVNRITLEEDYSAEASEQGGSAAAVVRIEAKEDKGRLVFDEVQCDVSTLSAVVALDSLSRRSLSGVGGLSESGALSLVERLINLGYARRERDNGAAVWTAKGKALQKALVGGGGVVGSGVVVDSTTLEAVE